MIFAISVMGSRTQPSGANLGSCHASSPAGIRTAVIVTATDTLLGRAHAAGISAQAVMTARPRRWPLVLMQRPSHAGVESACT